MLEKVWWCKCSKMESWSWTICCSMSCSNGGRCMWARAVKVHMPPWSVVGREISLRFGPKFMAKVNQHPQTHQLAILSMGGATFFHSIHVPVLTHIAPQSTFFGYWHLIFILSWSFFGGRFFPQPWPLYYLPTYLHFSLSYLANLHLGLTYKLVLKPPIYPPYLATLYFSMAKSLSFNKTFIYFWLNFYLLTKILFFYINLYLLVKPLSLRD